MTGPRPRSPSAPHENEAQPDAGYEQSHGYGPSHGGPSGPGDAPAKANPDAPPPPDDEEEEAEDLP